VDVIAGAGVALGIEDPVPSAAAGTATATITGSIAGGFSGRASGFETGTNIALSVIDAFARDASGRPTAELFVFIRARAAVGKVTFVPVTLSDLKNPNFIPAGSFAVYADAYDATVKDYTRWLIGQSGCITLSSVTAGQVGRAAGTVSMTGNWQSQTGTSLGSGKVTASVDAPYLRLRTTTSVLRDTIAATITGARTEPVLTNTADSYQVLEPGQTRLVVVASAPGDPSRELWLSLPGVPAAGDSITLSSIAASSARSGRAAGPFAMLRGISLVGIPVQPQLREVWPSSSGWVKLTNVVQTGPLALCGWATGRFLFNATGTDLITPGQPSLGTLTATGAFAAVFTVTSPSDTLIDPVSSTVTSRVARLASPHRSSGSPCAR
jgi:hypothetical protein